MARLLIPDCEATKAKIRERFGTVQQYAIYHVKNKFPATSLRWWLSTGKVTSEHAQRAMRRLHRDGVLVVKEQSEA